jgi:hypothetical protein
VYPNSNKDDAGVDDRVLTQFFLIAFGTNMNPRFEPGVMSSTRIYQVVDVSSGKNRRVLSLSTMGEEAEPQKSGEQHGPGTRQ